MSLECPACSAPIEEENPTACSACGHDLPAQNLAPASSEQRGWGEGVDANSFDCEGCGAQTIFSAKEMVMECPYCGSQKVVELPADKAADIVQPEYIIPFSVEREKSGELFRSWVGSRWFAPGNLKAMASAGAIRGVYLPFWVYDVQTSSHFSGQVGHDHKETEHYTHKKPDGSSEQRTRSVTRTRWRRGSGWHQAHYDDVLVCASKGLSRSLVQQIEPWKISERKTYTPQFLAGWEAERYASDADESWENYGRERVTAQERSACEIRLKRENGADRVKNVYVDVRFTDLRSQHMLLPAYISAYQYKDKTYRFMVNGQTGEVQGERPYSVAKIAILVIVILAVLAGLFFLLTTGG